MAAGGYPRVPMLTTCQYVYGWTLTDPHAAHSNACACHDRPHALPVRDSARPRPSPVYTPGGSGAKVAIGSFASSQMRVSGRGSAWLPVVHVLCSAFLLHLTRERPRRHPVCSAGLGGWGSNRRRQARQSACRPASNAGTSLRPAQPPRHTALQSRQTGQPLTRPVPAPSP